LELGLAKNEVKLPPYTAEWKTEFNRVKQQVIKVKRLEEDRIHHIGSTAINDMPAIIGIILGVDDITKVDKAIIIELQSIGFPSSRKTR